jgi:hypothetical protein
MINKKQATTPPLPITESKNTKAKAQKQHHVPPYGVSDPDGHVMNRIKQVKPALWAKIQNWD